ncbi:hypothetical protein RY831_21420 [Noviherbaspirillum sp. CPCC 100848]|uniref:Transposase n=1 Tax=Noviherbaspirillum album TaxID=3080276 RepID=A0ABU6JDL8_9BURK|nr:hypothetical protein [Noviherbaspirillum sp. CPCC 100848]MEC4721732.1 hypothetical protein [Noviherbaspirillum sp. CPCC 100848]
MRYAGWRCMSLANEQDEDQVAQVAKGVQETTNLDVEIAYVDQGYTGEAGRSIAGLLRGAPGGRAYRGEAKKGLVLLPRHGWLNAASPGPHASGEWHAIMNAWRKSRLKEACHY